MKSMSMTVFCLMAVVSAPFLLQGCLATDHSPLVTDEVVSVGEVTVKNGTVAFRVNLNTVEKGFSVNQIYDEIKGMAAILDVKLFQLNGNLYRSVSVPVVDGVAYCEMTEVETGQKRITATLKDSLNWNLFSGGDYMTVNAGVNNHARVYLSPMLVYPFHFQVNNLPGTYGSVTEIFRHTVVEEETGRVSQVWWDYSPETGVIFTAALPLDFIGGNMRLTDILGEEFDLVIPQLPSMVDWNTFSFGEVMTIENSTTLTIDVEIVTP